MDRFHPDEDAARLGQQCRDRGLTAGSLDLLIAAVAIHHQAALITSDTDSLAGDPGRGKV